MLPIIVGVINEWSTLWPFKRDPVIDKTLELRFSHAKLTEIATYYDLECTFCAERNSRYLAKRRL
jgi:hypothetical protein